MCASNCKRPKSRISNATPGVRHGPSWGPYGVEGHLLHCSQGWTDRGPCAPAPNRRVRSRPSYTHLGVLVASLRLDIPHWQGRLGHVPQASCACAFDFTTESFLRIRCPKIDAQTIGGSQADSRRLRSTQADSDFLAGNFPFAIYNLPILCVYFSPNDVSCNLIKFELFQMTCHFPGKQMTFRHTS